MTGRRVYPDENGSLTMREGDYGRDGTGVWFCRPPGMHMGSLEKHEVEEHEDRTITVSPSILLDEPGAGSWHGYLERGVWRSC